MSEAAAPAQAAVTAESVPAPAAPLTGKPMVHAAPSYSSTGGSLASMAGSRQSSCTGVGERHGYISLSI